MAITVQNIVTTSSTNSSGTTFTTPAGVSENDLLIVAFTNAKDNATSPDWTNPAGWTEMQSDTSTSGQERVITRLLYKLASASDSETDYLFAASATSGVGASVVTQLHCSGNAFSITPLDATDTGTTPSMTINYNNEFFVFFVSKFASGSVSAYTINGTNPTWTEANNVVGSSGDADYIHALAYGTQATATDVTSASATNAGSDIYLGSFIPITDVSGTVEHIEDSGEVFEVTGAAGVRANIELVEDAGEVFDLSGKIRKSQSWVGENKPAASDWVNKDKP